MSIGPQVLTYRTYAMRLRALFDQQAAERRDLEDIHAVELGRLNDIHAVELGRLNDSTGWTQREWDAFHDDHAPKYMNETPIDD